MKAKKKIKDVKVEKVEPAPPTERLRPKWVDWVLIDLPASSYIFGLKAFMLTRSFMPKPPKNLNKTGTKKTARKALATRTA